MIVTVPVVTECSTLFPVNGFAIAFNAVDADLIGLLSDESLDKAVPELLDLSVPGSNPRFDLADLVSSREICGPLHLPGTSTPEAAPDRGHC